ncbi:AraC family transcriptional regulator [Vallitalea maricola]|uniref:AraC family transcriptional regulator n=1 Tax=Vallitalea maricola TaxID=3074433 RepID=UPI0030D88082
MQELDEYLKKYNLRELFLKDYFLAKQNPRTYKEFTDNIDLNFVKENKIIIPELNLTPDSSMFLEEDIFNNEELNIHVIKHDRYTPVFNHKHSFFEILYIYSGHCIQNIMGDKITLNEGDLCILSPEAEHSVEVFDDSIVINILVRKSTFDSIFLEILDDENILSSFFTKILYTKNYNNYIIFRTNNSTTVRMSIKHIFIESLERRKYSNKMLNYVLLILFANLLRGEKNTVELPTELRKSNQNLSDILIYIQNNYKTVTLEELSNKFNFTVSHLSRLIKLHTGHNFRKMIQTIKLNKAIKLLVSTDLKICEINKRIGYENTTHFIRTFKKQYGVSPNQYRQNFVNKTN